LVWIDEWFIASIVLGFFLGLTLRYVKGDSLKIVIFLVGSIFEIVIAAATLLLALMWFLYLITSIVTGVLVYFLVLPLWAQIKRTTPEKKPIAKTETPQPTPRAGGVLSTQESHVLRYLENEWGPGFEPIHAQIIWAMSKGNHTVREIGVFLNLKPHDIEEAFSFMKPKGVFPLLRFPSASRATAWARDFIKQAEAFSFAERLLT
jgi:uncharacterized membrane protein YagU involved in acid resistance